MSISLNDLKLDEDGFLVSPTPLSSPEWDYLVAQLFLEWQGQKKAPTETPALYESLLTFLQWYRKQILAKGCDDLAVIDLYMKRENPI
jgi:hypothetical protein